MSWRLVQFVFVFSGQLCDFCFAQRSVDQLDPVLVPLVLPVMEYIAACPPIKKRYHSIEFMAGKKAITKAIIDKGFAGLAYDKKYYAGDDNDVCEKLGFQNAVDALRQTFDWGSVWAAPECAPWVFISRSGTHRTKTRPCGDTTKKRVWKANVQVLHVVTLLATAWLLGLNVFCEHPMTSLIQHYGPFAALVRSCLKYRIVTYLGTFGSASLKPIKVWSSDSSVSRLKAKKTKKPPLAHKNVFGEVNIYCRSALKNSKAYPVAFGRAVAEIFVSLLKARHLSATFLDDQA